MPQIDMNQPVKQEPEQIVASNPEETATVKMLMQLWAQGKAARKEYDQDWDELADAYNGKQWKETRPAHRSSPVHNIIYDTIQTQLPLLTDTQPSFEVSPTDDPSDYQFAEQMAELADNWWSTNRMSKILIDPLEDAKVYDAGFLKIQWDAEKHQGRGDVACWAVDPKNIWTSYNARDVNDNCPWIIEQMHETVGSLRRKFPQKAALIRADEDAKKQDDDSKTMGGSVTLVSPIDKYTGVDNPMPTSAGDDRKTATVLEVWIEDDAVEEYDLDKEDGSKEKALRKKFPQGRLVRLLPNCSVLLSDDPNPYEHGLNPYVRFVDILRARKFWGRSLARSMLPTQRNINKVLANILDYMRLESNPIWKIKKGAVDNPDRITNQYGMVLLYNMEYTKDDVTREMPPAMPSYFTELWALLLRAAQEISGQTDLTQGRRGTGDPTAAIAIESLQEAAYTRVRLQERNMQESLGQLGHLFVSLVMQFYKEPRVVKITGKQGWPEYFEFFIEDAEGGKRLSRRPFNRMENESGVQYLPGNEWQTSNPSKGIFDVRVKGGTSLPFAKSRKANLSLQLLDKGVIDREEVLSAVDWPNKEQVEVRMKESDQAAAAMQAAQGGPNA